VLELLENQARLRYAHETLCKHGEVYGLCFLTIFAMYLRVLTVSLLPCTYRIMNVYPRAMSDLVLSLYLAMKDYGINRACIFLYVVIKISVYHNSSPNQISCLSSFTSFILDTKDHLPLRPALNVRGQINDEPLHNLDQLPGFTSSTAPPSIVFLRLANGP